ncbi:MAG: PIG-L family deacetylase [Reichenbachiella sp.]
MNKVFRYCLLAIILLTSSQSFAQKPKSYSSSEILQKLQRLNVLGSVLYVAAHPDDENTRVITYLNNDSHFNTGYLSATRGDGGQNLVGPEIRESLGVIRTQELLAARRVDGGKQYFSRANDFGYSKNPEETFEIWDKEQVLADFVKVFRMHKPDVVITRFPTDGGGGHGHHTASAILAGEAFELATDPNAYPASAAEFGVWQPKLLVFNTHPWFYERQGIDFNVEEFLSLDLGEYNALLGQSYTEIAAQSRSQHKSQGFGATGSRGVAMEYFKYVAGDEPEQNLLEGLNTSWNRVSGGEKVGYHIDNALMNFDPVNPTLIIDDLLLAYNELNGLEDVFWKEIKQKEIKELIRACTGLYLEAKADSYSYTPGDSIKISLEAINRSDRELEISGMDVQGYGSFQINQKLFNNRPFNNDKNIVIKSNETLTQPYWLVSEGTVGMYKVEDEKMIGQPENQPALKSTISIKIGEVYLDYTIPLIYKKNDPVEGEVYRPIAIVPPIAMNIENQVYLFKNGEKNKVTVKVIAGQDSVAGQVELRYPKGWKVKPKKFDVAFDFKGQEKELTFELSPPTKESEDIITMIATVDGEIYTKGMTIIEYDHIPTQTLFPDASARIVHVNIEKRGEKVGYIAGAGDLVPVSLRQIGYEVVMLMDDDINLVNLKQYDAVVLGIRAFNTNDKLKFQNKILHEYVKAGGNVIVQYNTSHRLVTKDIAPYELELSRDRITVEEAKIKVLAKDHPVMNQPNVITEKDFDGWVQERGLYFPNSWDDHFVPILSGHDPDEPDREGGLLVAKYGEGYFIYTGYSWFRQLPAGVPGAYRIFANMISIGK